MLYIGKWKSSIGFVEKLLIDVSFKSSRYIIFLYGSSVRYVTTINGQASYVHYTGIAVDWISDNLYWTDRAYGHVMVARGDGRFQQVLISGLDNPRGIAAEPTRRYVYIERVEQIVYRQRSTLNLF